MSNRLDIKEESIVYNQESLAYVLGVLCGDGCLSKLKCSNHRRFELQTTDREFANALSNKFFLAFGEKPRWNELDRSGLTASKHKYNSHYYRIICHKQKITKFLSQFKSHTKDWRVPLFIKDGNNSIKSSFIRGMFDSEGDVTLSKKEGKYYYPRTRFSNTNEVGTLELKQLMKSIGVDSYISREHRMIDKYEVNVVRIIISGLKRNKSFFNLIGFSIKKKQEKLRRYLCEKDISFGVDVGYGNTSCVKLGS